MKNTHLSASSEGRGNRAGGSAGGSCRVLRPAFHRDPARTLGTLTPARCGGLALTVHRAPSGYPIPLPPPGAGAMGSMLSSPGTERPEGTVIPTLSYPKLSCENVNEKPICTLCSNTFKYDMPPKCPLCKKPYLALSKHLKNTHRVYNTKERSIILSIANGRINIRCHACIIVGCEYHGTRLDRHLIKDHRELSPEEVRVALRKIKKKVAMDKLQALRQSIPAIEMRTAVDDVFDTDEDVLGHPPALSPHTVCENQYCRETSAERDILLNEVRTLRYKLQKQLNTNQPRAETHTEFIEDESVAVASCSTTTAEQSVPPHFSPGSSGKGRGNTMRKIKLPGLMEEYIKAYGEHLNGIDPTPKQRENTISRVSRIKTFILYMIHDRTLMCNWLFLRDVKRIRSWPQSLMDSGKKVTTAAFYLKNVAHFVNYMCDAPCPWTRINRQDLRYITQEVKSGLRSLKRKVVVHQMAVKRNKIDNLPCQADLLSCMTAAKRRIPELLEQMAINPTNATRYLLYGYITLNWSCLYGHRPGVYANLTNAEFIDAGKRGNEYGYLIHVKEHKTANAFGEAQLHLSKQEFDWMKRWMEIKQTLPCRHSQFFLFTEGRGPSQNLSRDLRMAWKDVGLQGTITFTELRTALADNAKKFHEPVNRKKLSDFMCHNTHTADRFYAFMPDIKEAAEIRNMFTDSLVAAAKSGAEAAVQAGAEAEESSSEIDICSGDTSSSDEALSTVIYNDTTELSSSTDEELNRD
ncbi:uncharacterized protein LOC117548991 [Gymnodraco acuticeps]|uniref:Uncharacterized protein LOC117535251 n=1 Tax=Gymnodraco acuticeps TaxID=8218 RepID=A0A6P8SXX9_GYMAC|nr:uncharacterized protein LOC117535251 [Gymnodraco acuticeps]XP_034076418.1 uncharacterized protein LOC117548991 [Gymnodraco acuticeps]